MKKEKQKLICQHCGYKFDKDEDIEDYKHIEDTGECIGCFNTN